jgi:hypothetical protein
MIPKTEGENKHQPHPYPSSTIDQSQSFHAPLGFTGFGFCLFSSSTKSSSNLSESQCWEWLLAVKLIEIT